MAKHKNNFDWSVLNREDLAQYFWLIYKNISRKDLSIADFHRILSVHIKKMLPIRVFRKVDFKVESNWVYVGGTYYSEYDKRKRKCIDLELFYNPFEDKINIPSKRYRNMCYNMADTVLHEIIHMRQYRRRNFKDLPDYNSTAEKTQQRQEQSYLGCSDEIDAYGFNIACDLLHKFKGNHNKAISYLNKSQKGKNSKQNSWRMYLKAFDHDHNHPIIKRLKTKVIRYLPHAEFGKPYKNKDWICY